MKAKARRDHALARLDLRSPTSSREAAAGPTSHAIKARNPDVDRLVDEFLSRKESGQ